MMDFIQSSVSRFADWAFPLVMRSDVLTQVVEQNTEIGAKEKEAFKEWAGLTRGNYQQIEACIRKPYGMPELEMLRVEACSNLILGQWQSAVCITNVLLEAFLKLALVYSNTDKPSEKEQPLTRLMNSLSAPMQKYMKMTLDSTINVACKQGLIDKQVKKKLHECRERFRNAFFHADMQAMFGDQTTPITGADFGTFESEHAEVPIHSVPFMLGEAMWQNAKANAIPYFLEVDALIRDTFPRVFSNASKDDVEESRS
jgi:hypothetical protein